MLDTIVPLGEFLDEQIARVREKEIIETDYIDESDTTKKRHIRDILGRTNFFLMNK